MDGGGNAYVTGNTNSSGWVSGGWNATYGGSTDGYVVKLSAAGAHLWSTYLGGSFTDDGYGIAVDSSGNAYATGYTNSSGWVSGSGDTSLNGGDGYVVKLSPSGAHEWSSYVGGTADDSGYGIAVDGGGNVYVTGETGSPNWASGGWNTVFGGGKDAFVAKILQYPPPNAPSNPGATAIGTDTITWTWTDNSNNETLFRIWADAGTGAPATLAGSRGADTTSFVYGSLLANTQYAFQVSAYNVNGDSAKTDTLFAWTLAALPAAPVVDGVAPNAINVTVAAGDGNPAGTEYALYCTTAGKWVQASGALDAAAVWQTATDWGAKTVLGLSEHTSYSFTVTARNGAGVLTTASPPASGITLDVTAPTATITRAAASPTASDKVAFTVQFSEPLGTGFDNTKLTVVGTLAGTAAVTGSDPNYIVTVTLSNPDANGTSGITIPAGAVTDAVGNPYGGGSSPLYTVYNWPGFTGQPQSAAIYVGDNHTLSVQVAEGGVATSYKWIFTDGSNTAQGPATAQWPLTNVTLAAAGSYWCQVSFDGVSYASNMATIQVQPGISIGTAPVGGTVQPGADHLFSVLASGGYGTLSYQWKKDGANIDGATGNEYGLSNLTAADNGAYSVEISDTNGQTIESVPVTLTVGVPVPLLGLGGLALLGMGIGLSAARRKR